MAVWPFNFKLSEDNMTSCCRAYFRFNDGDLVHFEYTR